MTRKLVLLRHGKASGIRNRFTGWVDVDITKKARRKHAPRGSSCARLD